MAKRADKHPTTIQTLFAVYKKRLQAPQKTVIKTFQEVVTDLLNTEIPESSCEYSVSNKTLHITTAGPLKTELILRKSEILAHMKGRLGEKNAPKEIL